MWRGFIGIIKTIDWPQVTPFLGLTGGLLAFLFWYRRKTELEIAKLTLEIRDLERSQSRIYRPTADEIREVLTSTKLATTTTRNLFSTDNRLTDFGEHLQALLSCLADNPLHLQTRACDVDETYRIWSELRPLADSNLDRETIDNVEFLLRWLVRAIKKGTESEQSLRGN